MATLPPQAVENARQFRLRLGAGLTLVAFALCSFPATGCLWPAPRCEQVGACTAPPECIDPCTAFSASAAQCLAQKNCHWDAGGFCSGAAVKCATLSTNECTEHAGCQVEDECAFDCGDASDQQSCDQHPQHCTWNNEQF
ncbi:MAG TPA: hypothetical protein VGM44_25740 [Polyangiaceae bacterium]